MRAGLATIAALVVACKTRGTIEIAFDDSSAPCSADATRAVVYAEPNLTCPCTCGACFGAKPEGVTGCPDGFCDPSLRDVELDLTPGHWAVVLVLLVDDSDADAGFREVASACVDIDVDADGVNSPDPVIGVVACETTCEP